MFNADGEIDKIVEHFSDNGDDNDGSIDYRNIDYDDDSNVLNEFKVDDKENHL